MTKQDYEEIWRAAHGALRDYGLRDLSERLTPDVVAEAQDESSEEQRFRERPDEQLTRFLQLLRTEFALQSERTNEDTLRRFRHNVISETPITLEMRIRPEDRWRFGVDSPMVPLRGIPGMEDLVDELDYIMFELERERGRGYQPDFDDEPEI